MKNVLTLGALIAVFSIAFSSGHPRASVKQSGPMKSHQTRTQNAAK